MWPVVYTCLDIVYLVEVLNFYCNNPGLIYCNLVIQIFRYLSKTLDFGIIFTSNLEDDLVDYINFDYTRFIDDQKSTSSYIIILFNKLLSYQLKLQSIIPLLSTEAKYIVIMKVKKKNFKGCTIFDLS